ncbi:MAG: hypothetical protein JXA24_01865 [Proteobacteria bacterium]|nr:hypothetical protein [Pseudomonadota bacterium]
MSAGQLYSNSNQPAGYPPQQGYAQQQGYGPQQALSQPPAFTPVTLPNQPMTPQGGPNIDIDWAPKNEKFMQGYMWGQFGLQAGGMLNGLANMLCNYGLANKAMEAQVDIATKYYEVQDNIASYQLEASLAQIGVQEKAIDAQTRMHTEQCRHEEKMAKLDGNTKARLAAIAESGKNERAKIFSVTDAFSRSGWDLGSPAIAA